MSRFKNMKKLVIALIVTAGILISGQAFADDDFGEFAMEIRKGEYTLSDHRFVPQHLGGYSGTWFCIQGHGSFSATMERYDGDGNEYTSGYKTSTFWGHEDIDPPWEGKKTAMKYYWDGDVTHLEAFQDSAYIFASTDGKLNFLRKQCAVCNLGIFYK